MRAPIEVYFTNGQNTKVGQPLLLATGETQALVNVDLSSLGVVKVPYTFSSNRFFSDTIRSLITVPGATDIWVQYGSSLGRLTDGTAILTGAGTTRLIGEDFEGWMYVVNENVQKKFLLSDDSTVYDWGIDVPTVAPTVGTDGGGTRTYGCYYSWVAKFADGSEHETDLSPLATVATVTTTMSWSGIAVSSDSQVTHKRLYRSYLGSIWYVAEITNATTTYTDTTDDVTLIASTVFENTGYYPPPTSTWMVLEHYRRLFLLVTGEYSHWIFWSEPQQPLAFVYDTDTGLYANGTDVFHKGNPCTGMAKWGGELFIACRTGFRRLVGSNPSYWSLRDTLTQIGNVAKYAIQTTRWGVLHVWYDGIYLFNGYNSTNLTGKNGAFFAGINWDYPDAISSVFDGTVYRLMVPYGSSSVPTRTFVMDFETYPKIRCYEETQAETVAIYDIDDNAVTYAQSSDVGRRDGTDAVLIDIYSKAFAVANLIQNDGAARLHYEIDTGGQDVTLTVYHDNEPHGTTITLNTSSRSRDVVSIPLKYARTIALRLTGSVNNEVEIFEPWIFSN